MTFKVNGQDLECEIVGNDIKVIRIVDIYRIEAYAKDLFSYDERRIVLKTHHRGDFEISEEESSWEPLLEWLNLWASLEEGWFNSCFPQAFDTQIHVVWERNT